MIERFPFLNKDYESDFENNRWNIIEKVRAYHDDREHYDKVTAEHPQHKISFDNPTPVPEVKPKEVHKSKLPPIVKIKPEHIPGNQSSMF